VAGLDGVTNVIKSKHSPEARSLRDRRKTAKQWHDGRPDESQAIFQLKRDGNFTDEGARTFLRVFDDTIKFINGALLVQNAIVPLPPWRGWQQGGLHLLPIWVLSVQTFPCRKVWRALKSPPHFRPRASSRKARRKIADVLPVASPRGFEPLLPP
jgi:hypothetical protein